MIKLARNYHHKVCTTQECIVFEKKGKPVQINFGLYAGMSQNAISFGPQLTSGFHSGTLFGLRMEVKNLLNWTERISFNIDFAFQRFSRYKLSEKEQDIIYYNGDINRLTSPDYNYFPSNVPVLNSMYVDLKTSVLKVPVTVIYTFFNGTVRPYVGGGVSNMIILNQNKNFNLKRYTDEFNKSIPSFQLGYTGKAGTKFMLKNGYYVYLEMDYEHTQNFHVTQAYRFKNNLIFVLAGFGF